MFDFLPEELRKKAFIAGGWAACPALATDRDVWVTIDNKFDSQALRNHLESRALFYTVDFEPHDRDYPNGSRKFADLTYPWEKVQILLTRMEPEDVLSQFDISTHQIAITGDGRIIKGDKWTPVTDYPRFIHFNKRSTSDERMKKICTRFGHMPPNATLSQQVMNRLKGWKFNGQ